MINAIKRYPANTNVSRFVREWHGRRYVYALITPSNNPIYIGVGKARRAFLHLAELRYGCKCAKCEYMRMAGCDGDNMSVAILFESSDDGEAYQYEQRLLRTVPGLVNRADVDVYQPAIVPHSQREFSVSPDHAAWLDTLPNRSAWLAEQIAKAREARPNE